MIREFFYLQKSDRKVLLTLLVVIVSVFTMIFLTGGNDSEPATQQKESRQAKTSKSYHYSSYVPKKAERFTFDPNTADSTQLLRLGLRPWQVRNIYKYRAAGGIYHKPLDFAKLYGLTVKQYRELEPYIRISSDYLPASTLVNEKQSYKPKEPKEAAQPHYTIKIKETEHLVLNKYLVISHPSPKKLNVNKLTLNELKRHPYINFYMAKAITDYRRLHGDIHSLNDLRLQKDFSPEVIKRLTPYVAY